MLGGAGFLNHQQYFTLGYCYFFSSKIKLPNTSEVHRFPNDASIFPYLPTDLPIVPTGFRIHGMEENHFSLPRRFLNKGFHVG